MWDLAVREDDYAAVDSMLLRYRGSVPLSYRLPPAYARRDARAMRELYEEVRALDARQSQIAARYMATYLGDLAAAESLARLDLQPRRNAAIRLGAQSFLAWLEVARGNWAGARRAFADAQGMEGGAGAVLERALAATLPVLDVPRPDVAAVRNELERWRPAERAAGTLNAALEPQLRLYLLGLLSARLGEYENAEARAQELESLPVPAVARSLVTALAATVRADVAMHQRRPDDALAQLEVTSTAHVPLELVNVRPFVNARYFTLEHARYLRAEALRMRNRHDEARRWYTTSFQGSPLEMVYRATVEQASQARR